MLERELSVYCGIQVMTDWVCGCRYSKRESSGTRSVMLNNSSHEFYWWAWFGLSAPFAIVLGGVMGMVWHAVVKT